MATSLKSWLSGLQALIGIAGGGPNVVDIEVTWDVGAAGAVTLRNGVGWVELTRVSAGLVTISFCSGVTNVLKCTPVVNLVAATTGGVWASMTQDHGSNATPQVQVTAMNAGGVTATDPANGNSVTVSLRLALS